MLKYDKNGYERTRKTHLGGFLCSDKYLTGRKIERY